MSLEQDIKIWKRPTTKNKFVDILNTLSNKYSDLDEKEIIKLIENHFQIKFSELSYSEIKNLSDKMYNVILSLFEYFSILHKWFHFEDEEIIEIQLAVLIGEKIEGDPLWLFVIAPPGALKTEYLRSFALSSDFYPLSDLTSKTFVSGLMLGSGKSRKKIEDLLPQLNGKIIIFKDFTTILEKGADERAEIFAQLREIYDGSFAKKFGTLDKAVRYDSRFGLIAGVTPIIDKYWKLMQQLGERFVKVRWDEDLSEVTKKARLNEGFEIQMRKEINDASMNFIRSLNFKVPLFDDSKYGSMLDEIAKFIAISRTPIAIQDYRTDFYNDYIPTPERPTRLVKQLKKLCKCLAIIRGKEEVDTDEIKTILRVACDTIPQDRLYIMKAIKKHESNDKLGCLRSNIYKEVKLPESSIIKILEQLRILELIDSKILQEDSASGYRSQNYYYKLGDLANFVLSQVTLTVGSSKNTRVPSKIEIVDEKEAMIGLTLLHPKIEGLDLIRREYYG